MSHIDPDFFKLAREARGLSQKALADGMHVVQSDISKVESGKKPPSDAFVEKAADFFKVSKDFFSQPARAIPSGLVFNRKRTALSKSDRERIEAEARMRIMDVRAMAAAYGEPLGADLPDCSGLTPEEAARHLRDAWNVPIGPIENLVALLEKHRVFVVAFDFGTDLLDAFFMPPADDDDPCCIVFNANPSFPPDRHRFTLAHELGHVVLHRNEFTDDDKSECKRQESEANAFAGEFLAPESDIRDDLAPPLSFARLRTLKGKWKMSMASLVHRAQDLGVLKPAEAQRIWFFFGQYGYRKHEPDMGLRPEEPRAVSYLAQHFAQKVGLAAAASALFLTPSHFVERYPAAGQAVAVQGGSAMT